MQDFAAAKQEIASRFATTLVLSLGGNGALCSDGQSMMQVQPPKGNAVSAVGSGDSMLAGLVAGFSQGMSFEEAMRNGVAAGTANTLMLGAGQFSLADFEELRSRTILKPLN